MHTTITHDIGRHKHVENFSTAVLGGIDFNGVGPDRERSGRKFNGKRNLGVLVQTLGSTQIS